MATSSTTSTSRRCITDRYPAGRKPITQAERAFWRCLFVASLCASAGVMVSLVMSVARMVLS